MNYKIQIDGLRCLAVVSVLVGHWMAWQAYNPILKHTPWGHGVILFFVISGFLITDILLNQKQFIDLKKTSIAQALKVFYIRRFFRIFPIYYLLLFYLFYIDYPKTREIFPWLVTYTSNIYQGVNNNYVGNFNHFWSLAVEEQFYIFWPFLVFFMPKKHMLKLFMVTMIFSFASRLFCVLYFPDKWMIGAYFTPNLLLPLVLGGTLAYIKREHTVRFYNLFKPTIAFASLFIYGSLFYYFSFLKKNAFFNAVFDEYLFALTCGLFVATASIGGFTGIVNYILTNRTSLYIARISYGMYLVHLFIPVFFFDVFTKWAHIYTDDNKTAWVFYFILGISAASISFYVIEKPVNMLKNKFKY